MSAFVFSECSGIQEMDRVSSVRPPFLVSFDEWMQLLPKTLVLKLCGETHSSERPWLLQWMCAFYLPGRTNNTPWVPLPSKCACTLHSQKFGDTWPSHVPQSSTTKRKDITVWSVFVGYTVDLQIGLKLRYKILYKNTNKELFKGNKPVINFAKLCRFPLTSI